MAVETEAGAVAEQAAAAKATDLPQYADLLNCMRCGLCLPVCPTYRELGNETDSPRGRVALGRALAEGKLTLTHKLIDHMYRCLDCQACVAVCPSGVKAADLVKAMKVKIDRETPQPFIKKPLFAGLLPRPWLLELAMLPLFVYERVGLQALVRRSGLLNRLPFGLGQLEQLAPALNGRPLRQTLPEVVAARGQRRLRVGYFLGCAQNLVYASAGRDTVEVLARNGCEVVTPRSLKCCGVPHLNYGAKDLAREMARQNIAAFEAAGVDYVVTDCATCGSFTKEYAHLLAEDPEWSERARAFSERVRDISEFLVEVSFSDELGTLRRRVTYHEPCHLARGQGITVQPRDLLRSIPGIELVEMRESDWCCGGAGTYNMTHPGISTKILDRKMRNVAATDAEVLVAGCPACQMQLSYGLRRAGLAMETAFPTQLLAEAYRQGRR